MEQERVKRCYCSTKTVQRNNMLKRCIFDVLSICPASKRLTGDLKVSTTQRCLGNPSCTRRTARLFCWFPWRYEALKAPFFPLSSFGHFSDTFWLWKGLAKGSLKSSLFEGGRGEDKAVNCVGPRVHIWNSWSFGRVIWTEMLMGSIM